MFAYKTTIPLSVTDATGVIFFPQQFSLALLAMEAFLREKNFSLAEIIKGDFFLPVVHAEADYFAPLEVGDELEIILEVGQIGTSSFTLHTRFLKGKERLEVGKVALVHVAVSQKTRQKIPLPEKLLKILTS